MSEGHGEKITLGAMRRGGVRGLLVYCSDYRCGRHISIDADQWPDAVRLSDLEPRFVCQVCGTKGADIRPHFAPARTARECLGQPMFLPCQDRPL